MTLAVSIPFLLRAHVSLYTDYDQSLGIYDALLVEGTNYSWVSDASITMLTSTTNSVITLKRKTPTTGLLVGWTDGSNVDMDDLLTSDLQNLYAVQEQDDASSLALLNSWAALSQIAGVLLYLPVGTVAGIPAPPSDGQRVEVSDSTGIQSFSPLTGRPSTFVGATNLTVRLVYSATNRTWQWVDYRAVDPDGRYAGINFTQSGTGAVSRSVTSKLRDAISAKDFGAVGDGTTNDTAAIQAAINAANNLPVLLPAPSFNITAPLVTAGSRLVGSKVTVETGLSTGYGLNPTYLPSAPVLSYTSSERFVQSFRNSKTTAYDIYSAIYPNVAHYDGVQSALNVPAGSTVEGCIAVAGYVKNDSTGTNAVGVSGYAVASANGSNVWGFNTLISDSMTRAANADTGKLLIGYECDINIMSPNTQVVGVSVGGNSLATSNNSLGIIVNSLGTGVKWSAGFVTIDGVTAIGLKIGSQNPTGASSSQQILLGYRDAGLTNRVLTIEQTSTEFLLIQSSSPAFNGISLVGSLYLSAGKSIVIGGEGVINARQKGWGVASFGSKAAFNGNTATLAQTSAALAGVIQVLEYHGLIGA